MGVSIVLVAGGKLSATGIEAMADHASAEDDRGPLVGDFRALVHSVTVHPKGPWEGFEIEVKGKLAALIGGELFPEARHNSGSRVVAGGAIHAFPPPPSELFIVIRRERKAA